MRTDSCPSATADVLVGSKDVFKILSDLAVYFVVSKNMSALFSV